jgi:Ca2+/Na+ antiporter
MHIKYALNKEDFLIHQLYGISRSPKFHARRMIAKTVAPALLLITTIILLIINHENYYAFLFLAAAVAWFIFYPIYSKKNHYKTIEKQIESRFSSVFGKQMENKFTQNYIELIEKKTRNKINTKDVEEMIELPKHLIILLKSKKSLIIPKSCCDVKELRTKWDSMHLPWKDDTKWKW